MSSAKESRSFTHPFPSAGQGTTVRAAIRDAEGKIRMGLAFVHHIILMGIFADSPARCKLSGHLSLNAFLGCMWCGFNGVYAQNGVRWAGYSDPVHIHSRVLQGEGVLK